MAPVRNLRAVCLVGVILFFVEGIAVAKADQDNGESGIFDVTKYGAKADGETDDAKAFLDAWKDACEFNGAAKMLIPEGTFLLGPVTFQGPCYKRGSPAVELKGTLKALPYVKDFRTSAWITFRSLHGLVINGGGTIDGQGGVDAWTRTTCPARRTCKLMPSSVKVIACTDGEISGIKLVDGKSFHLRINDCRDFKLHDLTITAPEDSPNTDGIHVSGSTRVSITDSRIAVGDDCISIGDSNNGIYASGVHCGPGHGISLGSLGKYKNEKSVNDIYVKNCTLTGTTNGLRIKSWPGSTSLSAANVTFEDIVMDHVSFPILIDQKYCPAHHCSDEPSNVQISDVTYKNVRGSSFTRLAVNLICSSKLPCKGLKFEDVKLNFQGTDTPTSSMCQHAKPETAGEVVPAACILDL